MGLDMYLSKKTYVKNWDFKEEKYDVTTKLNGEDIEHIDTSRIKYVVEEVGYWRKDNHIHKWFVDNCQDGEDDCRDAYVSAEQLLELKELCQKTKEYLDTCEKVFAEEYPDYYLLEVDEDKLEETLPTQAGFFFGGTDYDRWYYESMDNTIDIIDSAMENLDPNRGGEVSFTYSSSW